MRIRKPSKMFKPQQIVYEEDSIRQDFYKDHPWELARPRILLETDGKDGQKCDWSKLRQPGRPLNGERYGPPLRSEAKTASNDVIVWYNDSYG